MAEARCCDSPSPVCSNKIGCEVGDRRVDLFGNKVVVARAKQLDMGRKRPGLEPDLLLELMARSFQRG